MLLTLSVQSLLDGKKRSKKAELDVFAIPKLARQELDFAGLTLTTPLLAGWEAPQLERFRDEADKASCPCLVLIEPQAQALGSASAAKCEAAAERIDRVLRAAHRLGCSSVVVSLEDPGSGALTEQLITRLKIILTRAERLELNLLLSPAAGLTETPENVTALIRKVGGFRIGSFPDFQTAAASGDVETYLRALAPYANAVCASITDFDAKGRHKGFDLEKCVTAIRSVGFDATMALEYRGKGDAMGALAAAKACIESCLTDDTAKESDE